MAPTKNQKLSAAVDASRSDKRRAGHTSSTNDRQKSNVPPLKCDQCKNKGTTSQSELSREVGSIAFSATTRDFVYLRPLRPPFCSFDHQTESFASPYSVCKPGTAAMTAPCSSGSMKGTFVQCRILRPRPQGAGALTGGLQTSTRVFRKMSSISDP